MARHPKASQLMEKTGQLQHIGRMRSKADVIRREAAIRTVIKMRGQIEVNEHSSKEAAARKGIGRPVPVTEEDSRAVIVRIMQEDPRAVIGRAVAGIKMIAVLAAIIRVAAGLLAVTAVLRKAMKGRTIDLAVRQEVKDRFRIVWEKTAPSTVKKKNAG